MCADRVDRLYLDVGVLRTDTFFEQWSFRYGLTVTNVDSNQTRD